MSKPVYRILSTADGGLHHLLEKAQHIHALSQLIQQAVDPSCADHIILANLHQDTAIVATDSPAWLTKVRYQGPAILDCLRQQGGLSHLRKVQFKIQPHATLQNHLGQSARRPILSPANAEILKTTADCIADQDLAEALRRLSQRAKNTP